MSDPKQPTVSFTPDQLKEILASLAQELRRPPEPTEQEKAELENELTMRRDRGAAELQKISNKKAIQSVCPHLRKDGTTHTVHIYGTNNLTDYMICQGCGAMIHAEPRPTGALAKELENHIFDTRLFNQHYLMSSQRTTF